jgi:pantothenate kinase type III
MCLNTESQLNDGLIYGLIGVLNQYITVNKIHYQGDFKIIMTGGTIFQLIDYIGEDKLKNLLIDDVIFDRDLMYKGLSKINLTNRNGDL